MIPPLIGIFCDKNRIQFVPLGVTTQTMSLSSRNSGKVVLETKQSFSQKDSISLDKSNAVTLLVLGDGDFSYSLDWARYITTAAASASVYPDKSLHMVATGLDSEESLRAKYRDANFLLKGLKGMDKTQRRPPLVKNDVTDTAGSKVVTFLRVSVHHCVNAIHPSPNNTMTKENPTSDTADTIETAANNNCDIPRAQHVLFHHPHLGTEDAALHAQFLCHLFHSVVTAWLESDTDNGKNKNKINKDNAFDNNSCTLDSFFHLTLVTGQFERWKCQEAADRNGMVLVDQRPFRSPRVDNSYYKHRRHQSGKSFASRAPEGSVTYTFVPQKAAPTATTKAEEVSQLVANLLDLECTVAANDCDDKWETEQRLLQCPHCEKMFREKRSRKAHIKAIHGNDDGPSKKRKRDEGETPAIYACFLCLSKKDGKNVPRVFQSAQALADHEKAKHTAKHDIIKPDWYNVKTSTPQSSVESTQTQLPEDHNIDGNDDDKSEDHGSCEVCGLKFVNRKMKEDHRKVFVPQDVLSNHSEEKELRPFECEYCKKAFRELRAKMQHENFCSHKPA